MKTEHLVGFRQLLVKRVAAVRKHPAAVDFRFFATNDPNIFLVFESFSSRDAWMGFAREPHSEAFLTAVEPMQVSPFQVQFLNLVDSGTTTPAKPPGGEEGA